MFATMRLNNCGDIIVRRFHKQSESGPQRSADEAKADDIIKCCVNELNRKPNQQGWVGQEIRDRLATQSPEVLSSPSPDVEFRGNFDEIDDDDVKQRRENAKPLDIFDTSDIGALEEKLPSRRARDRYKAMRSKFD